jgi:hypothetical protein
VAQQNMSKRGARRMEVYINSEWTQCYDGDSYMAEALIWSQNSNRGASIHTTGFTAEEADAKLLGILRELKLIPETFTKDAEAR